MSTPTTTYTRVPSSPNTVRTFVSDTASSSSSPPPTPSEFSTNTDASETLNGDHQPSDMATQVQAPSPAPEATRRPSSAPGSPKSKTARTHGSSGSGLTFAGIARLFVGVRRAQNRIKSDNIVSTSGNQPAAASSSSSTVADDSTGNRKVPLVAHETFVCAGGVDAPKLLRLTRETLLAKAQKFGANTLVDESWTVTVTPKQKSDGTHRAYIDYEAIATRSDIPDSHKPAAVEHAKGVPGLMTILQRA